MLFIEVKEEPLSDSESMETDKRKLVKPIKEVKTEPHRITAAELFTPSEVREREREREERERREREREREREYMYMYFNVFL